MAQAGHVIAAPEIAATLTAGAKGVPGKYNAAGRRQEDDHNIIAFNANQDPTPHEDESPTICRGATSGASTVGVAVPEMSHALTTAMKRNDPNGETYVVDGRTVVRRLTPTECERLQGFPDGWTCLCNVPCTSLTEKPCTLGRRYAGLGDAVTVNVARWIGERLYRYG